MLIQVVVVVVLIVLISSQYLSERELEHVAEYVTLAIIGVALFSLRPASLIHRFAAFGQRVAGIATSLGRAGAHLAEWRTTVHAAWESRRERQPLRLARPPSQQLQFDEW